jgi:hypothetical protein
VVDADQDPQADGVKSLEPEWKVADKAWVQLFHDPERAGSTLLNFAVDDLDRQRTDLALRGLFAGDVVAADKRVRLSTITDPDGNTITFIGGFRPTY